MATLESLKVLRNIINSKEKKRYNSANNFVRQYNTDKCQEHDIFYCKICLKCNIDICPICEKNFHRNHQTIKYEEIIPDNLEIENLQKKLKEYLDIFECIRNEIINWFKDIKEKINCFEQIYKKNEIINSYDSIMNYPFENKVCLESIYKFGKVYDNLMKQEYKGKNDKNKNIFNKLNASGNDNLPNYLNFQEIKSLLQNLKTSKENILKKNELIIQYLSKIPSDIINTEEKYHSINNYKKTESSISPIEKINSNSICDKSTGYDNYKTISENKISDNKADEFKKIINKTIITDFNIDNSNKRNLNKNKSYKELNNTFTVGKKKYHISIFNKYLNEMGIIDTKQDLHKINSSQDLLNKSVKSIKSTKYVNSINNDINRKNNLIYKRQNNIFKNESKSEMNSPKANISIKNKFYIYNTIQRENNNTKIFDYNNKWYNNPFLTTKKTQMKTFVHKKFKNNLGNNYLNNNICNTEFKIDNNIIEKKIIKTNLFNNNQPINKKEEKNKIVNNKIYEKPLKHESFKYHTINDIKNNNSNDLKESNEQNSNITIKKNNLLNLIYSPTTNRNKSNKSNIQLSKINKLNLNQKPPSNQPTLKIVKTNKNESIIINSNKELYIGLELTNSEIKLGVINKNKNEINLINFNEDKENHYSIPTIISFSENKKEVKIGQEAEKELLKNPTQTIFHIIKFFGKKLKDIKYQNEFLPFKLYSINNLEDKPYIKINFGPQKDKIIYFENILSIYLEKVFQNFVHKIKLEENSDNKINIAIKTTLLLAVPNYFSFYQRKLLQTILKTEVIPKINSYMKTNSLKFNFTLEKIYIKNTSSISSLCLNQYNIKNNINNNFLIMNIDKGSSNISLISLRQEKNSEKIFVKVKESIGMEKGTNDILNDFILYVLKNKIEDKIKKEILNSPTALIKIRKIFTKIINDLLKKERTYFNVNEILDKYNIIIEINKTEYEKCLYNYIYDLKQLLKKLIGNIDINNADINKIIFIGEFFNDEKIKMELEQFLKEKNLIFEEILDTYNENEKLNKEFYSFAGAAYYALNLKDNNILFQDISQFNLGFKAYNGILNYIIKKGDLIPLKNIVNIKLAKDSDLELYEIDTQTKRQKLICKFNIEQEKILDKNYMDKKLNYREIKIEYELNELLNLKLKIINENNISKELDFKLFNYC